MFIRSIAAASAMLSLFALCGCAAADVDGDACRRFADITNARQHAERSANDAAYSFGAFSEKADAAAVIFRGSVRAEYRVADEGFQRISIQGGDAKLAAAFETMVRLGPTPAADEAFGARDPSSRAIMSRCRADGIDVRYDPVPMK
jgi:hypothetical protein